MSSQGFKRSQTRALTCRPSPAPTQIFSRDHEYKRHGTVNLLAGIDLLTGKAHALVKDTHRSREIHRISQAP
jgi:hypothetical protein